MASEIDHFGPADMSVEIHRNLLVGTSFSYLTELDSVRRDHYFNRLTEAIRLSLFSGSEPLERMAVQTFLLNAELLNKRVVGRESVLDTLRRRIQPDKDPTI